MLELIFGYLLGRGSSCPAPAPVSVFNKYSPIRRTPYVGFCCPACGTEVKSFCAGPQEQQPVLGHRCQRVTIRVEVSSSEPAI